jgi:hypothetical protein
MDDLSTLKTEGWLECGRILQFLEIVLVGAVPDVHFGFEGFAAFVAVFPVTCMSFIVMGTAEGITIVVSVAAVPRICEQDILVVIVAYPIPTAIGLSDLSDFATQATARFLTLGLRCSHLSLSRYAICIPPPINCIYLISIFQTKGPFICIGLR